MALTQQHRVTTGGGEAGARRDLDILIDVNQEPEVEIELTESEPTLQQQQAYERFWKLFMERLVRERRLDKNA